MMHKKRSSIQDITRNASSHSLDCKLTFEEKTTSVLEANGITYQLGERLGRSLNSIVYSALNINTGEYVVIKQFDVGNLSREQLHTIESSYVKMKRLNHTNVIHIYDTFSDDNHFYVSMEWVECGSLDDLIKRYGPIPENIVLKHLIQILHGLQFLHKSKIVHKNIKTTNILVDKKGHIKLTDIGFNIDSIDDQPMRLVDGNGYIENSFGGSPHCMPPEGTMESFPWTPQYDMWSLGCALIEIFTGLPPMYSYNPLQTKFLLRDSDDMSIPDTISGELKDILIACLNRNPADRPLPEVILKRSCFHSAKKELKLTLNSRSSRRLKADLFARAPIPPESKQTLKSKIGKYKTFRVKSMKDPKMVEFLDQVKRKEERISVLSSDKNHRDVLAFLESFIDKEAIQDINRKGFLSKEDEEYLMLHELALLFETQLKKCLKEKRESIAIASFFKESLKDLNADYYQLLNHCDHLKYLHNLSKRCVSTLSDTNEKISKTLKRFCGDFTQKLRELGNSKMTKKTLAFLRNTNDIAGLNKLVPIPSMKYDILSQTFWNGSINRWNGQKWKPLKVVSLELWLIFYKETDPNPYSVYQIPHTMKILDYEKNLHAKYECFTLQDDMYASPNKVEFLDMLSQKYQEYGLNMEIEKKFR